MGSALWKTLLVAFIRQHIYICNFQFLKIHSAQMFMLFYICLRRSGRDVEKTDMFKSNLFEKSKKTFETSSPIWNENWKNCLEIGRKGIFHPRTWHTILLKYWNHHGFFYHLKKPTRYLRVHIFLIRKQTNLLSSF